MRPTLIAFALAVSASASAQEVAARGSPYSLELVDDSGRVLPTFEHRGRTYVLGALGQRYLLRARNGSGRRVEVVASVDGRDVLDGRPASFDKRGYVVAPYGEILIDGYRLSQASVAAFRFSSVPRSYAARTGDARDVGVIGVAVFPERWPRYAPPAYPPPYPPPYRGPEPYPQHEAPPAANRSEALPGPSGAGTAEAGPRPPAAPAPAPGAQAQVLPGEPRARAGVAPPWQRPGLGTEFGEEHASYVTQVAFERESTRPDAVFTLRYDDRAGLLALGIDVDRDRWARGDDAWLRDSARPFPSEPGFAEPPPGWQGR